jgi:manganese transport protein
MIPGPDSKSPDPVDPSLPDVYRSVPVQGKTWLKRFFAFAGPGYLVSVGYMDPGNWATDLAGGSRYGYTLLWVILVSNLMAMLLQTLCVRLGIGTGRDLAQACRVYYKKPAAMALWVLCEIAIIACDIAEVIGSAVALNLLFNIPLIWGVLITGFDVLILLGLMRFGFRKLEAVVIALVATIFGCFLLNIIWARPDWGGVAGGLFKPSLPDTQALLIAVGILGATVMPHNLYLHSSIVQTRAFDRSREGKKKAASMATIDVIVALGAAFFVNAAILILAAAVFHTGGKVVEDLKDAHTLLQPVFQGTAATLFAVALLCSGQSSTITGTLAGQIVMEGFLQIRIAPWLRRMITRCLAIIPAVVLISATGGRETVGMLTLSQVVLSMQLPFAVFPLVMFTADKKRMGDMVNPLWLTILGYVICILISALNVKLLGETVGWNWVAVGGTMIALFAAWVIFLYKGRAPVELEAAA